MTELIPNLYQFGRNEFNQLPQMDLIIDVGGIVERTASHYRLDGAIDQFKEVLNTPVLGFEIDEVDDEPFRNHAIKLNQICYLAIAGALFIRSGLKVCTLCLAGQNRSGLVSALILILLGYESADAVSLIQDKRDNALNNENIVSFIMDMHLEDGQLHYDPAIAVAGN